MILIDNPFVPMLQRMQIFLKAATSAIVRRCGVSCLLICGFTFALHCAAANSTSTGAVSAFPATPTTDAVTKLHGVEIPDPYRWLEDADSPKVQQWVQAQNVYTNELFSQLPQTEMLGKRIQELTIPTAQRWAPMLVAGTMFYLQYTPPQSQPILVAQKWPDGPQRILVDFNAAAESTAITYFWPSPSGRLVACSVAEGNKETITLRIFDTVTGKELPDRIPYSGGTVNASMAWDADEHGFDYVRLGLPKPGKQVDPFDAAVYHHTLGQDPVRDSLSFSSNFSPIADLRLPIAEYQLFTSSGGQHAALLANTGDGGPSIVYLRSGRQWKRVLGEDADVRGASWIGQRLFVIATGKTPRGKLLAIAPDGTVSEVLAQGDTAMQAVNPVADGFLLTRSWGPDWKIEHYDANGKLVRTLALPDGISIDDIANETGSQHALIAYTGWTVPIRWVEYDALTGDLKTIFDVKPVADYSHIVVTRLEAISSDSTHIPVTVLSLPGATRNGIAPTILTAFGEYGMPMKPRFMGPKLAWLERGGVYAVANIRGGNEFGEGWHRQGMKTNKQRGADDFYAVSQALVTQHWTTPEHLGIAGASSGGLIMGMALTQHPAQYRAVVAFVGIFDMLRTETYPNGRYNVTEFGSVNDPEEFRALFAYSPLQHVRPQTAYPAVFLETSSYDLRVAVWQSRKFTAALQAATTSGRPVALLTRMSAKPGSKEPLVQRLGDQIVMLSFFAAQLGLATEPAVADISK